MLTVLVLAGPPPGDGGGQEEEVRPGRRGRRLRCEPSPRGTLPTRGRWRSLPDGKMLVDPERPGPVRIITGGTGEISSR